MPNGPYLIVSQLAIRLGKYNAKGDRFSEFWQLVRSKLAKDNK